MKQGTAHRETRVNCPPTITPPTPLERALGDIYNAISCRAEDMAAAGEITQAQAELVKDIAWKARRDLIAKLAPVGGVA